MTGAKKSVTKEEQPNVIYNQSFGTKLIFTTYRGFKRDEYEYPTLAASLYSKLEELIDDLQEELKIGSGPKNIYVKAKSTINLMSTDVFESFIQYYLHKLAHRTNANVVLISSDMVNEKLKKRFVAAVVKNPDDPTFFAIGLNFLGEENKARIDPRALFKRIKKMGLNYLQKHWKELGIKGDPKIISSIALVVASEFPEDEVEVHVRDGHDTVKITIPLRKPEWTLDDFPDELAEELGTLVIGPISRNAPFAPKGLLLVGPPGVGKTILVEAIAGELGKRLLELEPGLYRSMWYGQTEKMLKEIFNAVRQRKDIVILIDDAEFLMDRGMVVHEGYVSEMNMFLKMLQNKDRPLVAMTTNHPQLLDQALVRPGRIDLVVIVGYPDKKFRRKIVERILKKYNLEVDEKIIENIVRITKWFTNAEIDSLIRMAAAKGGGRLTEEAVRWARRRFHVNESERERIQDSLRWYAGKLQGMVISYVKDSSEV